MVTIKELKEEIDNHCIYGEFEVFKSWKFEKKFKEIYGKIDTGDAWDFGLLIELHNHEIAKAKFQTLKDVLKLSDKLKDKIDNAQEDCGNLDWISKEQALDIIDKELKLKIEGANE